MASLQDIRRRIKSVKSIQQITKAMKMVAAARLRRAQTAAINNRPYASKMAEVVRNVAAKVTDYQHPLLVKHEEAARQLFLVVASDKGLAGAYASNVFKEAVAQMPADHETVDLVAIGRKTEEHFRNRHYHIVQQYLGISERPTFDEARDIAADIAERYTSGEYNSVKVVYTRFVSAITSVPESFQLLPFENLFDEEEPAVEEPQPEEDELEDIALEALEALPDMEDLPELGKLEEFEPLWEQPVPLKERLKVKAAATREQARQLAAASKLYIEAKYNVTLPKERKDIKPFLATLKKRALPPEKTLIPQDIDEEYIFEPSAEEVLNILLPQYLVTTVYAAQLQAAASELSSRMTAMSNATDNAEEINRKLDLQYNKVRQANITREISEIVGGAEALK